MENLKLDLSAALDAAAACLEGGGVVLLPTDTVYGLAALPTFSAAVERLYRIKERPLASHLPVVIGNVAQLDTLGVRVTENAATLIQSFWPGALTVILGFDPTRARPSWLAKRPEVAVRLPDVPFLKLLCAATGPLLITSANPHGAPTSPRFVEAVEALKVLPDLAVDGGELADTPSTIVNVRPALPEVERVGAIEAGVISARLGARIKVRSQ